MLAVRWSSGLDVHVQAVILESHGARIGVRAPNAVLDLIVERAASFAHVAAQGSFDTEIVVTRLPEQRWRVDIARTNEPTKCEGPRVAVADCVIDQIHPLVAEHARQVLFVHAGTFALDGMMVVVPGRSRSGKSTLVANALRRGATYYSDEFAVVDPDGLVHPYPRTLSLRRAGRPRRLVTAEQLGASTATEPAPASFVLSTRYREATSWDPDVVTGARAALPLIANTPRARSAPAETTRAAAMLAGRAITLVGDRGEASEVLKSLREWAAR